MYEMVKRNFYKEQNHNLSLKWKIIITCQQTKLSNNVRKKIFAFPSKTFDNIDLDITKLIIFMSKLRSINPYDSTSLLSTLKIYKHKTFIIYIYMIIICGISCF